MTYNVNFIGLTFFEPLAGGGRRALMPDGRIPPPQTQAHWASISVRPADLISRNEAWLDDEISERITQNEYFFPPSIITFPTTADLPELDTIDLNRWLIHLRDRDPQFELSADPQYVASVTLRHGVIKAFRVPNTLNDGKAQYFARWTVPHNGTEPFTITLEERRGWPFRTLTLEPGSDVTVINTSRGEPLPTEPGDHFQIYEQLSGVPVTLRTPGLHRVDPVFKGILPVFTNPQPATDALGCSPTDPDPNPLELSELSVSG